MISRIMKNNLFLIIFISPLFLNNTNLYSQQLDSNKEYYLHSSDTFQLDTMKLYFEVCHSKRYDFCSDGEHQGFRDPFFIRMDTNDFVQNYRNGVFVFGYIIKTGDGKDLTQIYSDQTEVFLSIDSIFKTDTCFCNKHHARASKKYFKRNGLDVSSKYINEEYCFLKLKIKAKYLYLKQIDFRIFNLDYNKKNQGTLYEKVPLYVIYKWEKLD